MPVPVSVGGRGSKQLAVGVGSWQLGEAIGSSRFRIQVLDRSFLSLRSRSLTVPLAL